jgi:hypothetical protein
MCRERDYIPLLLGETETRYFVVSPRRIHVYYDVVNVLWAHRKKSIRKLHMHCGLQEIWYRNNTFYKLCVRIDPTNDNQYRTSSINSTIGKCFHSPNSQGAPNMVKQKHNSTYGITKLPAGNVQTVMNPQLTSTDLRAWLETWGFILVCVVSCLAIFTFKLIVSFCDEQPVNVLDSPCGLWTNDACSASVVKNVPGGFCTEDELETDELKLAMSVPLGYLKKEYLGRCGILPPLKRPHLRRVGR